MTLQTALGPLGLASPLVAMSGTVGSVVDWIGSADPAAYGAAVAKSVSGEPWPGRPEPRVAPTEAGMLNGIGIQNPGATAWASSVGTKLSELALPVIGSAVGNSPGEYADVAKTLSDAGVAAVEVNLSCPNLEDGKMFALDPEASAEVIRSVAGSTSLPIGAKLSPNSEDIAAIAAAAAQAGASWVTLTNTVWGAAIDIDTRKPRLSGVIGGYSGVAIKPIALRCVIEVRRALPGLPILGAGGVRTAADVIEYAMAGASAVGIGTAHFADPGCGKGIGRDLRRWMERHSINSFTELVGAAL